MTIAVPNSIRWLGQVLKTSRLTISAQIIDV